jgi:hypothetical protein
MDASGQLHAPASISRVNSPLANGHDAGCAPEPIWTLWSKEISLASAWIRTPATQPVTRRYTD